MPWSYLNTTGLYDSVCETLLWAKMELMVGQIWPVCNLLRTPGLEYHMHPRKMAVRIQDYLGQCWLGLDKIILLNLLDYAQLNCFTICKVVTSIALAQTC